MSDAPKPVWSEALQDDIYYASEMDPYLERLRAALDPAQALRDALREAMRHDWQHSDWPVPQAVVEQCNAALSGAAHEPETDEVRKQLEFSERQVAQFSETIAAFAQQHGRLMSLAAELEQATADNPLAPSKSSPFEITNDMIAAIRGAPASAQPPPADDPNEGPIVNGFVQLADGVLPPFRKVWKCSQCGYSSEAIAESGCPESCGRSALTKGGEHG